MMLPPTPFYKSGKKIRKQVFKFPVTWEVSGEILTLGEKLENLPSGVAQKPAGVAVMAAASQERGSLVPTPCSAGAQASAPLPGAPPTPR